MLNRQVLFFFPGTLLCLLQSGDHFLHVVQVADGVRKPTENTSVRQHG
jgi:hypothetical protein